MIGGSEVLSPRRFMALSVASVVLLVAFSIILGIRNEVSYRHGVQRQAESQAAMLASSISAALTFDDVMTLRQYARAVMIDQRVEAVAIYGPDQTPLVRLSAPGDRPAPDRLVDLRSSAVGAEVVEIRPVIENGQRLGAVFVRTRGEPTAAFLARHGSLAVLTLVAFVLLALANWAATRYAAANGRLTEEMRARHSAEAALVQAQKMEAMGQMTGGVAHDFNNLLMVASSGLELLDRTQDPQRRQRIKDSVRQAIDRGASLTQQLLAFSRRAPLRTEVVNLSHRLRAMRTLLERSVSPNVKLSTDCPVDLWPVEVDAAQFEVAVLNMAVNARDAMKGDGRLSIRLYNQPSPEQVVIEVIDTGAGMSPEVAERIFEPFFTTKPIGKGTGLGLSQVYGFVRSSNGEIVVTSLPGEGTAFTIRLPRTDKPVVEAAPVPATAAPVGGERKCVLVVEDNEQVSEAVAGMLQALGYEVRQALTGEAALETLERQPGIDLVLSDMVMPGSIDGLRLAHEMERRGISAPIILTTGYTSAASEVTGEGRRLLSKPYRMEELASEIAAALKVQGGPRNVH